MSREERKSAIGKAIHIPIKPNNPENMKSRGIRNKICLDIERRRLGAALPIA